MRYARVLAPKIESTEDILSTAPEPRPHLALHAWHACQEIDLAEACRNGSLAVLNRHWPHLSAAQRVDCLQDKRFVFAPPAPDVSGIFLLPGGVLALCAPEGILVADPLSAVAFSAAEAKAMEDSVRRRKDAVTIVHAPAGVVCQSGLPAQVARQSATLLPGMNRYAKCAGILGPGLIQWGAGGAVVWALREAPPLVALALRANALQVLPDEPPLPVELWAGGGSAACAERVAPGLAELVNDLLCGEVCDDLRHALLLRCVTGSGSVAACIGAVLSAVPSCFQADSSRPLGTLPGEWPNGCALLAASCPGHVLFGIEAMADPVHTIGVLRDVFPGADAALFLEAGVASRCATVDVAAEAALFVARRAGTGGRIGLIVQCEHAAPADLYGLADRMAYEGEATVTVSAPASGFCHRIDRLGQEAGNAAWFGMGAGLDEMDVFAACDNWAQ